MAYPFPQVFTYSSKPRFGVAPPMSGSVLLGPLLAVQREGAKGDKTLGEEKEALCSCLGSPPCEALPICEMRMTVLLLPATQPRLEAHVKLWR